MIVVTTELSVHSFMEIVFYFIFYFHIFAGHNHYIHHEELLCVLAELEISTLNKLKLMFLTL